jgi:ubiquinone/menaquinone biosynthesis C-methylase UbiE
MDLNRSIVRNLGKLWTFSEFSFGNREPGALNFRYIGYSPNITAMNAKYDRIGIDYNETRRADPYLASRLIHHLQPKEGETYLDIGCGTGNYTAKMAEAMVDESGGKFIGVDPSEIMLENARARTSLVDWRKGTAENIPVEDAAISGVTASFTMHHWADLKVAFRELSRVMKPGARMVILTATPEQMTGYWLGHYFPQMLKDSMEYMPDFREYVEGMAAAGLEISDTEKYFIKEDLQDWFLYSGKHDPARYLDPRVRKGISSFADMANRDEVEAGLRRLKTDVESGEIARVIKQYENDLGDYLFVAGVKPRGGGNFEFLMVNF